MHTPYIIYLGLEEVANRIIALLIVIGDLARREILPYIAGHLEDREGYGAALLGKPVIPGYGRSRWSTLRRTFLTDELVGDGINEELNHATHTDVKNQPGRHHDHCVCDRLLRSRRGEMIFGNMANQRAISRYDMDVAEVRRRVDERGNLVALPAKIENGRYGVCLSQDYGYRRRMEESASEITHIAIDGDEREVGFPRRKGNGESV